jgi:hypothetical protein
VRRSTCMMESRERGSSRASWVGVAVERAPFRRRQRSQSPSALPATVARAPPPPPPPPPPPSHVADDVRRGRRSLQRHRLGGSSRKRRGLGSVLGRARARETGKRGGGQATLLLPSTFNLFLEGRRPLSRASLSTHPPTRPLQKIRDHQHTLTHLHHLRRRSRARNRKGQKRARMPPRRGSRVLPAAAALLLAALAAAPGAEALGCSNEPCKGHKCAAGQASSGGREGGRGGGGKGLEAGRAHCRRREPSPQIGARAATPHPFFPAWFFGAGASVSLLPPPIPSRSHPSVSLLQKQQQQQQQQPPNRSATPSPSTRPA